MPDSKWLQAGKGGLLLIAVTLCDSEIRRLTVETGFGVATWKRWVGAVHGHPRTSSCAEISSIRSMMAIEKLSSCDLFTAYQQCDRDRGAERADVTGPGKAGLSARGRRVCHDVHLFYVYSLPMPGWFAWDSIVY